MKTILFPTEPRTSTTAALETALLLARRFDSYIEGFALQSRISEFVAVDMGGSFALDLFKQESEGGGAEGEGAVRILHAGAGRGARRPVRIRAFIRLAG